MFEDHLDNWYSSFFFCLLFSFLVTRPIQHFFITKKTVNTLLTFFSGVVFPKEKKGTHFFYNNNLCIFNNYLKFVTEIFVSFCSIVNDGPIETFSVSLLLSTTAVLKIQEKKRQQQQQQNPEIDRQQSGFDKLFCGPQMKYR